MILPEVSVTGDAGNGFSSVASRAFMAGIFPTGLLPPLDEPWCERFGSATSLQPFIKSSTQVVTHLFDPMIRETLKKFQKTKPA
jgi:hypothetical protein